MCAEAWFNAEVTKSPQEEEGACALKTKTQASGYLSVLVMSKVRRKHHPERAKQRLLDSLKTNFLFV